MKIKLYTIIAILVTFFSYSQANKPISRMIFLDSLDTETSQGEHLYSRIIKNYFSDRTSYEFIEYYKSGNIKSTGISKNKDYLEIDGTYITYFENGKKESISNYKNKKTTGKSFNYYDTGNIQSEIEYLENEDEFAVNYKVLQAWNKENQQVIFDGNGKFESFENEHYIVNGIIANGLREGKWEGYNKSNTIKFIENYAKGKLVSGITTDSNGIEIPYTLLFEKAKPEKGLKHFYDYVRYNFVRPNETEWQNTSGKIHLTFTIEKNATVNNIAIIKGINEQLDQEAIRTIQTYNKWLPGYSRGLPVRVQYRIPITLPSNK